jgi:hypothetical protein
MNYKRKVISSVIVVLISILTGPAIESYSHNIKDSVHSARILNPDCTDFETAPEIVLRDDGGNADLGYPWSVQLDDKRVLVTYYYNIGDGYRHIAGTILEIF